MRTRPVADTGQDLSPANMLPSTMALQLAVYQQSIAKGMIGSRGPLPGSHVSKGNKYYADLDGDPELKDVLEMRKAGSYVPINEERVKHLTDQNGTEVKFEELVVNGRTTGFVRCMSIRCQTMMLQKIRKQVY